MHATAPVALAALAAACLSAQRRVPAAHQRGMGVMPTSPRRGRPPLMLH